MINFSAISNRSMIGRALRLPLRAIPKGVRLPILQGPLRGMWWIAGSSVNGALLGTYELDTQRHLVSGLTAGGVKG